MKLKLFLALILILFSYKAHAIALETFAMLGAASYTVVSGVYLVCPKNEAAFEKTKQKVLQLEASRSAYEICTESNDLLSSGSKKSCDALFADFLKAEKLYNEALSQ